MPTAAVPAGGRYMKSAVLNKFASDFAAFLSKPGEPSRASAAFSDP
jgi:hypothetical protein